MVPPQISKEFATSSHVGSLGSFANGPQVKARVFQLTVDGGLSEVNVLPWGSYIAHLAGGRRLEPKRRDFKSNLFPFVNQFLLMLMRRRLMRLINTCFLSIYLQDQGFLVQSF